MSIGTVGRDDAPGGDVLDAFLIDISRFDRLSAEEERRLAVLSLSGDPEARRSLVESNLRLVIWCAKPYRRTGIELLDLVQDGVFGLIDAAARFDPDRGCRFSTFAVWRIRGALTQSLRAYGYRSSSSETSWPTQLVDLAALRDEPAGIERPADAALGALAAALAGLAPRERMIIEQRYGLHDNRRRTLHDVGVPLGLSHERIRQIQRSALRRLRDALEADLMSGSSHPASG